MEGVCVARVDFVAGILEPSNRGGVKPLGNMPQEDVQKLRLSIERANLGWLPRSGIDQLLERLGPPRALPRIRAADANCPRASSRPSRSRNQVSFELCLSLVARQDR